MQKGDLRRQTRDGDRAAAGVRQAGRACARLERRSLLGTPTTPTPVGEDDSGLVTRYARTSARRRAGRRYVTEYLRAPVWFRRRDRWFEDELKRAGHLECAVCMKPSRKRELELHHLDYSGVVEEIHGGWIAGERHEDLVAVHPRCHRWITRRSTMTRPRARR